jgi:hypothetical protein
MLKKKIVFAVLMAALLISFPAIATQKVSSSNLKIISDCVKPMARFQLKKVVVIAIYDGPTYNVVRRFVDNQNVESWDQYLIQIKDKKCKVLYSPMMGDNDPVSVVYPGDLGRKAIRDYHRYFISINGREEIQEWIDRQVKPIDPVESDELRKLGFKVK